jgi:transcriptional regulator
MYLPAAFTPPSPEALIEAIRLARIGDVVTGSDGGRMEATTLPLLWEPDGDHGRLVGHLARANPHVGQMSGGTEALVLFHVADAYVSPAYYASKREHGKVVPTWNYISVQARGTITLHREPEWLLGLVNRLTDHHEAERTEPWSVADAPPEFIDGQLRAIVGIEIALTSLEGKWKLSQNRPEPDRLAVIEALAAGTPTDCELAAHMHPGR